MNNLALHLECDTQHRDVLVQRHASLVARIAHHLKGRLPDTVEVDDLIQAGMIGLLEAARNFRNGLGAGFETFAGIRIRGAMLDEVRRNDWVPRSLYRRSRELSRAVREVEARTGREAQPHEVAAQMGVPIAEYHQLVQEQGYARVLSVEELGYEDDSPLEHFATSDEGAGEALQHEQLRRRMAEEIAALPQREALVLSLYYDEELNLREIGEVLSVSESRVCQLHGQAVARLRARLERCE